MAWNATCDICNAKVTKIANLTELNEAIAFPGQVENICKRCSKKLDKQTSKLGRYYHRELLMDLREYILELAEN